MFDTGPPRSRVEEEFRLLLDAWSDGAHVAPAPGSPAVDVVLAGHGAPPLADDGVLAAFRAGLDADADLLDAARTAQRATAAAQAAQVRAVAAFAARRPVSLDLPDGVVGAAARESRDRRPGALATVSEFCVDELAVALTINGARAEQLALASVLLVHRLPLVLDALESGQIGWEHARVACDLLGGLSDDLRERAETELLHRASGRTAQQWRQIVRRWVMRADADAIAQRVVEAVRSRAVSVHPGEDGMATLSATLPLPVARAVEDVLRQYARAARTPGDDRSAGERMADCLVALVLDPGGHGMTPVQAQLTVVAAVETLLDGDEPGEVAGDVVPAAVVCDLARALGLLPGTSASEAPVSEAPVSEAPVSAAPVSAATSVELAGLLGTRAVAGTALAGVPRIALADAASGELVALTDAAGLRRAAREGAGFGPPDSTDRYRPGAVLDAFVRLRDRRCRFPGCRVRAGVCDVDHQHPWAQGGPTAECNLACLCTHHHRLSHQAPGWQLQRAGDGTGLTWTTPTGQVITTRPPQLRHTGGGVGDRAPADRASGARDGEQGTSAPVRSGIRRHLRPAADPDPPPF